MPRPKRTRQAAQASSSSSNHGDEEPQQRGRTRATRSSMRMSTTEQSMLRAANRNRDEAIGRLANEDATSSAAAPVSNSDLPEHDDSASSIELGRRVMETPSQRRDTTGLDLGDDMFGDLEDSFEAGEVPKGGNSANTSSFTFSSMKPRSRQSSIIGRNDPPIRPSSRAGSTPGVSSSFNIGLFRRRAREPSILGTGRKSRADVTSTTRDLDSESEEEDFAPEAESTPLNKRRTRASTVGSRATPQLPALSGSRKRKSDDAPESSSRAEKVARSDEPAVEISSDSESDSDLSSLPSPQALPRSMTERPVTPNQDDEIMAPPASSGSEDEGAMWPDIHALAKRRRRPSVTTPVRPGNLSDVSSPPSLTHSPNLGPTKPQGRGRSTTRRERSPVYTTADLAGMLPKRRARAVHAEDSSSDEEELDTSGLAHDEDELAHGRTTRKKRGDRPASRATSTRSASRAAQNALQPRQTPASNTRQSSRRGGRTYSSRSADKENQSEDDDENEESGFQPFPDDTFDESTRTVGLVQSAEELQKAAKKFKEVDRWELEFEEAEVDEVSPEGAR